MSEQRNNDNGANSTTPSCNDAAVRPVGTVGGPGGPGGAAPRLPAPHWTPAGHVCYVEWKGHGLSQHSETRDLTLWKNVRMRMTVHWNGEVTIEGCGASVLKRNCLGATQALESLAIEELIRQHKSKEDDRRRFPGLSNSIKRADAPETQAAAAGAASANPTADATVQYTVSRAPAPAPGSAEAQAAAAAIYSVPAGATLNLAPIVAAANAAAVARASINIQVPHQQYPGVGLDEVAIPFLLFGRANLKTGVIHLEKVHVKWAWNNITYRGRITGSIVNGQGVEEEMPLAMLLHQMDAFTRGEQLEAPIQAIRMELNARWSRASLAFIARPQQAQPDEAMAPASATAVAVAPASAVLSSSSSSSSSSLSFPSASSAHSLASSPFSLGRPVTPSTLVLNTPAPSPRPTPSPAPSPSALSEPSSSSSSPGSKGSGFGALRRSPSPTSAASSSSPSSSSSSTPRLVKHESAAELEAEAAAAGMEQEAADADSASVGPLA